MNVGYRPDKLVLFDWNGVLDTTDFEHDYNYQQLMRDSVRYAFDLFPHITEDDIWREINKVEYFTLNHDAPNETMYKLQLADKFARMFDGCIDPNLQVRKFIKFHLSHMKYIPYYKDVALLEYDVKKWCKVGICSDLAWIDHQRLKLQIDTEMLDYAFLSYEIMKTKAAGDIFEYIEEMTKMKGESILLIDDTQFCCDQAAKFGWKAYRCHRGDVSGMKVAIRDFLS